MGGRPDQKLQTVANSGAPFTNGISHLCQHRDEQSRPKEDEVEETRYKETAEDVSH